jgi:hypothetical protein
VYRHELEQLRKLGVANPEDQVPAGKKFSALSERHPGTANVFRGKRVHAVHDPLAVRRRILPASQRDLRRPVGRLWIVLRAGRCCNGG